jgi:hypothetical protein
MAEKAVSMPLKFHPVDVASANKDVFVVVGDVVQIKFTTYAELNSFCNRLYSAAEKVSLPRE